MSRAGRKNWTERASSSDSFQKRCGVVGRDHDGLARANLPALALDLEDESTGPHLGAALLLWVNVLRLALGRRRIHAIDPKLVGADMREPHPLTGARVEDLLAFVRDWLNLAQSATRMLACLVGAMRRLLHPETRARIARLHRTIAPEI